MSRFLLKLYLKQIMNVCEPHERLVLDCFERTDL